MTTAPTDRVTTVSEQVAEEIRALLARRRMSQRQLAQQLDVSPAWVNYRLTGAQAIDINDMDRIARALGVQLVELLPRQLRGNGDITRWYSSPTERTTRRVSSPPDNRPPDRPHAGSAPGIRRSTYLPRNPGQKAA